MFMPKWQTICKHLYIEVCVSQFECVLLYSVLSLAAGEVYLLRKGSIFPFSLLSCFLSFSLSLCLPTLFYLSASLILL